MLTKIPYVLAVVTAVGLSHVQGAIDCSQRPPRFELKTCCPMPNLIPDELNKKCRPVGDHKCYSSCVLKEMGIMVNGQMDVGNLDIYLTEHLADVPDLIELVKTNFLECNHIADYLLETVQSASPRLLRLFRDDCSPKDGIILGLSLMKTLRECPDSVWSGTDKCNYLREWIMECQK